MDQPQEEFIAPMPTAPSDPRGCDHDHGDEVGPAVRAHAAAMTRSAMAPWM
jgi:hypothetical protein